MGATPHHQLNASQRRQQKFIDYAQQLRLQLDSIGQLAAALRSPWRLAEVALVLGTSTVTPREVYRIQLPASAADGPSDDEGTTNTRFGSVEPTVRACLRRLYALPPEKLHHSVSLGKQLAHFLARLVCNPAESSSTASPDSFVPPEPWRPLPRYQLDTACRHARLTHIALVHDEETTMMSAPASAATAAAQGPASAVARDGDGDRSARKEKPPSVEAMESHDTSAAQLAETSTDSTGLAAQLTLMELEERELWLALPALPRCAVMPANLVGTSENQDLLS